jgi:hypothetical protein
MLRYKELPCKSNSILALTYGTLEPKITVDMRMKAIDVCLALEQTRSTALPLLSNFPCEVKPAVR